MCFVLLPKVGSFEYMAPDVVNIWRATELDWSHTYDKRCDLWSLGVIL
jgi:serine/threonine protein kinase